MKQYGGYALLLSVFLLAVASNLPAQNRGFQISVKTPDGRTIDLYQNSYALVIGIDKYTQGWPILSGAVQDAKLVADELQSKGFNVTYKENLNSSELKQVFEEFFILKGENPQTRLFVWFAGHGHTLDNEGFLVPADAPDPKNGAQFKLKALSLRRFGEFVRLAKSKHAFAVFDSCFSGTIFETARSAPPAAITRATTLPVRQFLTAGDVGQTVSDDGRFRKLFIRALRGEERADANGDGYLTGSELGMFLTDRITNLTRSRQTPRYGKIRDEDYDRGDFVFQLASSGAYVDQPSATTEKSFLSVESNVRGAEVSVDGRRAGQTPLSDVEVAPGERRVYVTMPGYSSYQQRITFEAGRKVSLFAQLTPEAPQTARLYVNTQPDNAIVKILNIGPAFFQGMELDPGQYRVEVSALGHETQKMQVSLDAGEDKRMDVRLKPVVGAAAGVSGEKVSNSLGMEFVYIKPGTFMMGSPSGESGSDSDEIQHQVTLTRGFYMQTTEVTQAQWKAVMGGNPSNFKGDDRPVEKVSWEDVQAFIQKLNQKEGSNKYRLPTEAEWEYAARAGSTGRFSFGDDEGRIGGYAWYDSNSGSQTHPVAQKSPNAWGLYDMHGNVWEWVQDWYGGYPSGSVTDPEGPSNRSFRVLRGGSWGRSAGDCRSAGRDGDAPGCRNINLGFRLALLPGH